jgi:predicted dienelactone hydrolase
LRHHRPAHGDTQTQIATSAFGATIPHGSANRHPSKPHKPRRFTPQCEKCGLAINHPGDTERDTSSTDSLAVLVERPADIKRSIDYILETWPDASRIDARPIGFYGFSFGGYTGLVVIGADPDLRKVARLPNVELAGLQGTRKQ